jgi:hypothetical protein
VYFTVGAKIFKAFGKSSHLALPQSIFIGSSKATKTGKSPLLNLFIKFSFYKLHTVL